MVEIAVISTLDHPRYSVYGDIFMFLTPLLAGQSRHPRYVDYCKRADGYSIIDNGAFELEDEGVGLEFEQVVDAAVECDADEIILTDYLYDGTRTLEAVERSLNVLSARGRTDEFTVHAVPQGEDFDEWSTCFDRLLEDERIDVLGLSKLSVPRVNDVETSPGYLYRSRTRTLEQLAERYESDGGVLWKSGAKSAAKKVHLLGGGPWLGKELASANEFGFVRSVDSSMPVWYGLNGHSISTDTGRVDEVLDKVDLHWDGELTDERHEAIMHNIATLHSFSKGEP